MPESPVSSIPGARIPMASVDSRVSALEAKVGDLENSKSDRLSKLSMLISLVVACLAIPSGVQSVRDVVSQKAFNTGFRSLDPLSISYDAEANRLQVDITVVALNEGREQDQIINFQRAALGNLSAPSENLVFDSGRLPFAVDPQGIHGVTIKATVLFDHPEAAAGLNGDQQSLTLLFTGLEGSVTTRICFPLKQEDLTAIISTHTPLRPVPTECNQAGMIWPYGHKFSAQVLAPAGGLL